MLMRRAVVSIVVVGGLFSVAGAGTVIHVDDDTCPGPGNGTELDPYCSIQDAINAAVDADAIVVASGRYFETIDLLGKAITLVSSSGPDATIIDAAGFSHAVRCVSGEGPDTVLTGFTITGGNADGDRFPDDRGGGMLNLFGSSPTITNCTFTGNTAVRGGGMYNAFDSNPSIAGCMFSANISTGEVEGGGGMHNTFGSNPSVTDCTFSGNVALGALGGGGMFNFHSSLTVSNCTFSGNSAPNGGGMYIDSGSPTVEDCTFEANLAGLIGGGMHSKRGRPTVVGCLFVRNHSNASGGGMSNDSDVTVTGCIFDANSAEFHGGGMLNYGGSSPSVINCLFVGNSARNGGAMSSVGTPTITNCTFAANRASDDGGAMYNNRHSTLPTVANCILWSDVPNEIVDVPGAMTTVRHSDLAGGWSGIGSDNIDVDPLFVDPDNGDFRVSAGSPCIDAGDNAAVPEGIETDLGGNPRFLDVPETPDTGSGEPPVVDMGAFESLGGGCLALTSYEVDCHPDGSTFTLSIAGVSACTGGPVMAAFTASGGDVGEELCFTVMVDREQGGFCCATEICTPVPDCSEAIADLDGDGVVNVVDLMLLLASFGPCQGCWADLDHDGAVGVSDLLILLANWE